MIFSLYAQEASPDDYKDKPYPVITTSRLNFYFDGWRNQWSGSSITGLLDVLGQHFGTPLDDDISWFTSENGWPQSAEEIMLNPGDEGTIYDTANQGSSYIIDEYGRLLGTGASTQPPEETFTYYAEHRCADGRVEGTSAGWNSKTAMTFTIHGKEYTLVDKIYASPVVLDLDGDGKLQASRGKWLPHKFTNTRLVEFDINGDGFVELTEWVGPNDGLLIAYNGQSEVNGTHLFGDVDGFLNGFEKLSVMDKNADNKLNGEELKGLSVWQDKNGNAKVDKGEILSLESLNITELNLDHKNLMSSYQQDGESRVMWDWRPCTFMLKLRK